MKILNKALTITSLTLAFVSNNVVGQGIYWQDNFDSFGSPSTVTASGNNINGYDIKFSSGNPTTENFTAIFGFDYSTVSYPISIPSAPNSGGTTKGLYLTVNKLSGFPNGSAVPPAAGTNAAVNLYPVGQSFSGDFKLKFDVWMNWTNLSFSTEAALFGINHSGTLTNRIGRGGSDGLFFGIHPDGGNSATSTSARDLSIFAGQGTGAPLLYRTNNTPFTALLGTRFDNTDPGISALFPSKPIPGYPTTPAGSPGLGWVQGEVRQEGTTITWLLDNVVIAQFNNTNSYTSGDIMLGYSDLFNSVGDANDFAILDNIVVSTIPEPTAGMIGGLGLTVVIAMLRRRQK